MSYKRVAVAIVAVWSCMGCAGKREPQYDMMENLTARYNIVYHGRKIIHDVMYDNTAGYVENYEQRLPVFIEPTDITAASNSPLMDSVIGKALTIINKKSKSKYISEAYLLTGQANYLKGNYYNAAEYFSYTAGTFADMPEYRQAALVWKARALMQLGNLTESGNVLDTVFTALESDPNSMGLAFATQAKYYLLVQDEASAITMLLQALEHTKDKSTRLRWHFLLGQLLESQGRPEEAYPHYSRVVNSNASYEMAFHAGLNRIFLPGTVDTTTGDRIRLLQRMLRDGKNKEYRDQIYYQIAEMYSADGDWTTALVNYEQALRQQGDNRYQTTRTYLRLADHYFDQAQYPTAKLYYDSVGMYLPMDFPDAGPVQRKVANLDELITQLEVVSHQDSLFVLAGLPEAQRHAQLDSLAIARYVEIQDGRQAKNEKQRQNTVRSPFEETLFSPATTYTDNRFYFNNPDAMGMGTTEFKRRWGNRPLQDNWRFSDMTAGGITDNRETGDLAAAGSAVDSVVVDSAAWVQQFRDSYLNELPDTESKQAAANNQIHTALLRVGELYRDELLDNKGAIDTYEDLLNRYPETKDAALIYYNLYLLYNGVDQARAAAYKEKLLTQFPDALYSRILLDPMYLAKLQSQKQLLDQEYEEAYAAYTHQQFQEVIQLVDSISGQVQEPQPTLVQLAYLRALALGRTSGIDTLENAFRELVDVFPDDSLISPLVHQHLAYIAENSAALAGRRHALQGIDESRMRFIDEPTITPWPQLIINHGPERPVPRRSLAVSTAGQTGIGERISLANGGTLTRQQLAREAQITDDGENAYRNLELLPDSAVYYFVINVMNERVNLAPSRYGIGQFNRTRYTGRNIMHQLKPVNDENQLVYVGPFLNYEEAKTYEVRIMPLLPDIMKIPATLYNTFLITEDNFGTLSDFDKIDDYYTSYHEQE